MVEKIRHYHKTMIVEALYLGHKVCATYGTVFGWLAKSRETITPLGPEYNFSIPHSKMGGWLNLGSHYYTV